MLYGLVKLDQVTKEFDSVPSGTYVYPRIVDAYAEAEKADDMTVFACLADVRNVSPPLVVSRDANYMVLNIPAKAVIVGEHRGIVDILHRVKFVNTILSMITSNLVQMSASIHPNMPVTIAVMDPLCGIMLVANELISDLAESLPVNTVLPQFNVSDQESVIEKPDSKLIV